MLSENRKIGVGLTGLGVIFLILGILLFFDRALLALGNMLFISGITFLIGVRRTVVFFAGRYLGTACFLLGLFLVLWGWTIVGMIIEFFGFLNLFGDFFPVVLGFLRQMPIIGHFLNLPIVASIIDRLRGGAILPTTMSRRD